MKEYKKFIIDVLFSGWIDILNNLKNFMLIPILTKSLGVSDYGIWVQMKIFLTFLVPVAMLGMSHGVVRYLSGGQELENKKDFGSIVLFTFLNSIFLCLTLYIFSKPVASLVLHDIRLFPLVRLFSYLLIFEPISILALSYFRSRRMMKLYSLVSFFEICLEFSGVVLAIRFGYGFAGALTVMLAIRAVFVIIKLFRIYEHTEFFLPAFSSLKKFILFSFPLFVSTNMFYIVDSGDKYVINLFLGLKQSAVYALAYSLAYTIVLITAPVVYILYPAIAACCNNNKLEEAKVYVKYSYKLFIIFGVPFCFSLTLFARELISLIATKDFLAAAGYLPVLVFSLLIFQIGVISEYINLVFNRTRFVLYLHTALAIFNISLNLILVPRLQITGALIACAATYILFFVINFVNSRRLISFELEPLNVLKTIMVTVVIGSVIRLLDIPLTLKVVFVMPVAVLLYICCLFLLGVVKSKEIQFIRSLFMRNQHIV